MRQRTDKRHRGIGVFFVVIVSLVVLVAFIGIFQLGFSRQVVDHVTRASLGEVCLVIAESATNEALYQIRQSVNKPDDRMFNLFRKEVLANQDGTIPLEIELKEVKKLLEGKHYRRFYIDDFKAEVLYQKQFSRVPYEKYGIIGITVKVGTNLSLTDKISRTVQTGCEFKIALVGPPRPFDQVTLMVTDANSLVSDANYRVQESIRDLEASDTERDQFVDLLNSEKGNITSFDVNKAIADLKAVRIPSKQSILDNVHEILEPLTIFTVRETVDLSKLDLPQRLDDATRAVADIADDYRRARDTLERNIDSESANINYRTTLERWVEVHRERISAVEDFQDFFTEYSGSARNELANQFYFKLDEMEWRKKAFYYITGAEGNVNQKLDELRQKQSPLNGIVFIDNPNQTLNLEGAKGQFNGNVIVVTSGNVNIGGSYSTTTNDLLTVVSYGTVSVDGHCRASVIANKRASVNSMAQITGNLVLREVRDFSALRGKVIKDPRLYSGRTVPGDTTGAYKDYYYVAVGPGETYRHIRRK